MSLLSRLRRSHAAPTDPVNPHPDRSCDSTCDITDAAHSYGVMFTVEQLPTQVEHQPSCPACKELRAAITVLDMANAQLRHQNEALAGLLPVERYPLAGPAAPRYTDPRFTHLNGKGYR